MDTNVNKSFCSVLRYEARQDYLKMRGFFPSDFVKRNMDVVGTPGGTYFIHWVRGGALAKDIYMEKTCDNANHAKAEAYDFLLSSLFYYCPNCGEYLPIIKSNDLTVPTRTM